MPVAMLRDHLLFVGIGWERIHRCRWKKNWTNDRVDRGISDHREEQIAEEIVNDVGAEREMKQFFVGELVVIDRWKNDA